jgi:Zn finger protein HypA/HybF involved in hydrogenase expression
VIKCLLCDAEFAKEDVYLICPKCREINDNNVCLNTDCGISLHYGVMVCPVCGTESKHYEKGFNHPNQMKANQKR